MATKYTVYKITEADRTKKIVSVYADMYRESPGGVSFYETVDIPGGWFAKDTSEVRQIAVLNIETKGLFIVDESKEVK